MYSEQELVRRKKLAEWCERGDTYPNDAVITAESVAVHVAVKDIGAGESLRDQTFEVAGRILAMREMGKVSFVHLQDKTGRVQVYVRKDELGEDLYSHFRTFDLGDIVSVSGFPCRTKTGEPTIHATNVRLLVKCLHPLPEKWHGLTDVEIRYRQRYLDLMVNPEVQATFIKRAQIVRGIRKFFDERGYIEVETPVMSTIASGASAKPFVTHHNALDVELNLRIALELPLKKLIVGGLERVYEIGRVFRNEGISTEHNPEFSMIEFYQAYATFETLMDLTEELVVGLCDSVVGSRTLSFKGREINFNPPWKRLSMAEAILHFGQLDSSYDLDTLEGVHRAAKHFGHEDVVSIQDWGKALYEVFDRSIESLIVDPTFITYHPTSISPLARKNAANPLVTDRFELMVAGMELANAFSELNDSIDQRERFEQQLQAKDAGDEEAMALDEDFVTALEYGMPPTAGQGIGIDRLVMLLTDSASIRDVILFPTMRPLVQSPTGPSSDSQVGEAQTAVPQAHATQGIG